MRSHRVDGILLAPASGEDVSHLVNTIEGGTPVVCLDRAIASVKTDAVLLNNARGSLECTRHMLRAGYREIAIITGDLALQTARERLQGYKRALREAGIEPDDRLILRGDFRQESGYRLGRELASRELHSAAVLVCNGVMAVGVLKALEEAGISCPGGIGLATFDDFMEESSPHPHLTTVIQPSREIGRRAATLLIERIEGRLTGPSVTIRVSPTLVERDSTKGP